MKYIGNPPQASFKKESKIPIDITQWKRFPCYIQTQKKNVLHFDSKYTNECCYTHLYVHERRKRFIVVKVNVTYII